MTAWGLPAYRGRQIFDALHRRATRSLADIHEVPRDLRERLEREMPISLPEIIRREPSEDGSVKYGLRLSDGALVEAVYMPGDAAVAKVNEFTDARAVTAAEPRAGTSAALPTEPAERFTVCLSSQTGCAVDCAFCVTGRLGEGATFPRARSWGSSTPSSMRPDAHRRDCGSFSWGWGSPS